MSQPGQQNSAVAVADQKPKALAVPTPVGVDVLAISEGHEIERYETTITIPADYQYAIPVKGKKLANGDWDNTASKIGLSADGYDFINRILGVSFFLPEWVHDEQGEPQRNPIHRKDYIYLRMGAVWRDPVGQLMMATEDVEVDFALTWMDARINAKSAQVVMDPATGLPAFDDLGRPQVTVSKEDELKALKTLSQLRTFGPRYAQTVARVRLLKMASGIRSLPGTADGQPHTIKLPVVGFRDRMTAQERIEKAGGDLASAYGKPDKTKPLTAAELDEVGVEVDPDVEQMDRDAVAAAEREDETAVAPATIIEPDDPEIAAAAAAIPTR